MKQVNFKSLKVEIRIDEFDTLDLRKEIGNAIHRQATDIAVADLSRSIYYSDGPIEIDDENYNSIMQIIEKSFALLVSQAVKNATKTIKMEEEKVC